MSMAKVNSFLWYLDYQRVKNLYNPDKDQEQQAYFLYLIKLTFQIDITNHTYPYGIIVMVLEQAAHLNFTYQKYFPTCFLFL